MRLSNFHPSPISMMKSSPMKLEKNRFRMNPHILMCQIQLNICHWPINLQHHQLSKHSLFKSSRALTSFSFCLSTHQIQLIMNGFLSKSPWRIPCHFIQPVFMMENSLLISISNTHLIKDTMLAIRSIGLNITPN